MSKETLETLNSQTLIGVTANRGKAWHYREAMQGDESNHYDGFIPVADVLRRLFNWEAVASPVAVGVTCSMEESSFIGSDGLPKRWVVQDDRVAMVRSDNAHVMGLFKDSYVGHNYSEWLVGAVSNILGDSLGITSAGVLRQGAQAWVEVSFPETLFNEATGFGYRPNLLATTSFDGTIATTYKNCVTATVCDNTRAAALAENSPTFKARHTKNSGFKLESARAALGIVERVADNFDKELEKLASMEVTDSQWSDFMDHPDIAPLTDPKTNEPFTGNKLTRTERYRDELCSLYRSDERAAQWQGTALGVMQAVNTHAHHFANVRGADRVTRNMEGTISGKFADIDHRAYAALTQVLAAV